MSKEDRVNKKMQQLSSTLFGMQLPIQKQRVSRSYNKEQVLKVIANLIENSAYFEVDPCCFDVYQVTVKREAEQYLPAAYGVNGMSFEEWIVEVDRHYVDGLSSESKEEFRDYFLRGLTSSEAIYQDRVDDEVC